MGDARGLVSTTGELQVLRLIVYGLYLFLRIVVLCMMLGFFLDRVEATVFVHD